MRYYNLESKSNFFLFFWSITSVCLTNTYTQRHMHIYKFHVRNKSSFVLFILCVKKRPRPFGCNHAVYSVIITLHPLRLPFSHPPHPARLDTHFFPNSYAFVLRIPRSILPLPILAPPFVLFPTNIYIDI